MKKSRAERQRQIEHGFDIAHDAEHNPTGELARAAACYCISNARGLLYSNRSLVWPWMWPWWKPRNRRHDMIRAAALIVAEIERIDRGKPAAVTHPAEPIPDEKKPAR